MTDRQDVWRVSIANWVLRDESTSNRLTFPRGLVLGVGESITVVTGCSGPPAAILWCSDMPVWSNGGDTVIVSDTLGNAVIWYPSEGEQFHEQRKSVGEIWDLIRQLYSEAG